MKKIPLYSTGRMKEIEEEKVKFSLNKRREKQEKYKRKFSSSEMWL